MPVGRRILVSVVVMLAIAACGPASTTEAPSVAADPAVTTFVTSPTAQSSDAVVWGRVPYCNCFAGSATVHVAKALKEAKLTVDLKELSPRDGWLYFAVTFDPLLAAGDQVVDAMEASGAEVLDSPP